jgi:TolB-like protein/class 3 adenylate cyclase/tetratricopeptide (TPR) repeat protein
LTGERVERRLAAVLAADVAGYSRLMGVDEEGTLARLKVARKAIVDPAIASHRGRIVKTTGDGMLVEFASAVDAVRCSVEVQRAITTQNAAVPQDVRIEFRIGIHVGDIIIDDNDIFGDGVNIAARLEGIAEPCGVCISDDTHRQVRGKVEIACDDMGPQPLKNIAEPMRVWRLRLDGLIGSKVEPRSLIVQAPVLALPDKPSIAVLPFQNMSGDPEQEYFADGMVEDIITALSRFKLLFVIARNSSFTYKGKSIDIKQVGRELGVRYVLEGSVRRAGNKVRITGQLVDASTAAHLWADHFDGILEDIFDLQDRVTGSVVAAIAPKVQQAELERSTRKPTESLGAYDYYLRGLALYPMPTKESTEEALRLFSQAIALDPNFAAPYAAATRCYSTRKAYGWVTDPAAETAETNRLIQRAIKLGTDDAFVLGLSGFQTFYVLGDVEGGAALIERARALNSNLAILWGGAGLINVCLGQAEIGIAQLAHAMRLSPLDPSMALWHQGIALGHFYEGRDDEAVLSATIALREGGHLITAAILAASHAFLGHIDEAKKAVAYLQSIAPNWRLSNLPDLRLARREKDRARYIEGLRRAGMPE